MDRSDYLFAPGRFADKPVLRPVTAPGILAETLERFGGRTAVVDGATRLTWAETAARAKAFAAGLGELGIVSGDVVALHLPNAWEYLVAHLGIGLAGAVTFPLHVAYREAELRSYLGYAGARAIVTYPGAAERILGLRAGLPDLRAVVVCGPAPDGAASFGELVERCAGREPGAVRVDPEDPFILFSTSGTESLRPKVCIHTHGGFLSNKRLLGALAGVTERDVILSLSGYTHAFGIAAVELAATFGASIVCLPKYDPAEFLRLAHDERATMAWAVPAQLDDIAALHRGSGGAPIATLREVRTGGAQISPALSESVRTALCPTLVIQWGMSEIGCGLVTRHGDPPEATATLGLPLEGGEIRIVDGELWYRHPCMFRGYYRDPETTAAALTPDGWLKTGDLASLDAAGRVVFQGRSKDIINRGGMKVSAFEIEAHLTALPAIRQLAVVGIEDARLGDRTCVVCSLYEGATLELEEITRLLDARSVAKYKWPEHLLVLDQLPTTPTGKVAKSAVRALVASLGAGAV